jgi:hypothetical protein
MHVTTFKLQPEKLVRLREVAEAQHRTVSQELRYLVDRRLEEVAAADKEAA